MISLSSVFFFDNSFMLLYNVFVPAPSLPQKEKKNKKKKNTDTHKCFVFVRVFFRYLNIRETKSIIIQTADIKNTLYVYIISLYLYVCIYICIYIMQQKDISYLSGSMDLRRVPGLCTSNKWYAFLIWNNLKNLNYR